MSKRRVSQTSLGSVGSRGMKSRDGLRPEKIELARERLSQGFYDSPAIDSLVVEKLLADPQFLKSL